MKSIKSQIIMVILSVVCLLCLIFGIVSCYLNYNTASSVLKQSLTVTAQTAAERVAAEILSIQNVAVETGCIADLSDAAVPVEEKQAIIEQRAQNYGFQRGNLLGLDGVSYFDGNDYSERDYFQAAVKGNTYISSPTISKITGKTTFLISAPLWRDGVPNSTIAGVIYYAPNESFLNDIVTKIQVSGSGYAYMINKSGMNVADSSPEVVGVENSIADAQSDPSLEALANIERDMIAGGSGFSIYPYEGDKWVQGYAPVGNTDGWSLGVAAKESDFLGNFYAALVITLILAVVFILVGLLTATVFANRIGKPLRTCSERLRKLAQGDLTSPVETVNRNDEVGVLTNAAGELVTGLSDVVRDMSYVMGELAKGNLKVTSTRTYTGDFIPIQTATTGIIESLNGAMRQIRQASDQVSNGAEQVSSGAQALSQGATEQAGSIEELSATIGEIAAQVAKNAEVAISANQLSTGAGIKLVGGNQQMEELKTAILEISEASQKIGEVMKAIDNIAFQTNILALNAAVEAARAGAAGKGFAVVADEVRALATKSADAAKGSKELIEGTVRAVGRGTELAKVMAETLVEVMGSAKEATDLVGGIADASREQAESIAQVTIGIEQVSAVVQTNSATAEESAATSEELAGQAHLLQSLVERFQI